MGGDRSVWARIRRGLGGAAVATFATVSMAAFVSPASAAPGSRPPAGPVRVEGIFGSVHADPTDGRGTAYTQTFVTDERDPSKGVEITMPPAVASRYGGVDTLLSKRVAVTAVTQTRGPNKGDLTAVAVEVLGEVPKGIPLDLSAGATATPKPQLTVLCKFADKPVEPQTQAYFSGLTGDNGLMDSYFRTTSYQQINLLGSKVVPAAGSWLTLPGKQATYIDGDGKMTLRTLYTDCSGLAATQVNLNDFSVINMAFNTDLVGYGFGGGLDSRRLTWLTPKIWKHGGHTAHEIGHAFNMDHTGTVADYDNAWDVMSGSGSACTPHPTYACVPQHQSAYNKLEAGWLNGRVVEVPGQATTTVDLQPLDNPGAGPVMARLAVPGSPAKHAYLVELRRPFGLDAKLPLAGAPGAVNIYEYWERPAPTEDDPNAVSRHIQLMGKDGAAGARWLPGSVFNRAEMFTGNFCDNNDNCTKSPIEEAMDYEHDGVRIRVDSISPTKATVTFTQLPKVSLSAGSTTPSSYEVHWSDTSSIETFYRISYTDLKKKSGQVMVPANATSFTYLNAPSGVTFMNTIQACNSLGCGPGSNQVYTGADPKPIKNN